MTHISSLFSTGKILKSNSRAYVPHRASSQVASERNSLNLHRRTQSEAPPVTHKKPLPEPKAAAAPAKAAAALAPAKLAEVRPRYLEPRKPRAAAAPGATNGLGSGPVRSATSSSIPANGGGRKAPAKNLHISSSDSSRNSSPAARRVQNGARLGNKSSNLSMDSLASPARRAKSSSRGPQDRYSSDQNSLAESMKSSVITNKTISHESLSGSSKLARVQLLNGHGKASASAANAAGKIKATQRGSTVGNKSTRQLKQQHNAAVASNGSSPSSVHTTKSAASRLSSVSSTLSTRELFKQRSISVPAGGTEAPNKGRHSFLSAKSREILAKRAEKNKLQQQQQQQQKQTEEPGGVLLRASAGPLRSSSHSAVTSMLQQHNLRNSLPSSIPTRRPNTLHLKKTTATAVPNGNGLTNGSYKSAQAVKQKLDLLIDAQMEGGAPAPKERVESKLERSSTFCKDSADLDISELQIVE